MSIEALKGRSYGPGRLAVSASLVSDFVTATTDAADGFTREGPPAMAALALFAVAPRLLAELGSRAVIHGEQSFHWHRPFSLGSELTVGGVVTRVRERGGVFYLTFEIEAGAGDGDVVVTGSSLFLIGGDAFPSGVSDEATESAVDDAAEVEIPRSLPVPAPGEAVPPLRKSVSRAGLVRYAAATRDWNPIHWDHGSARAAGLPGVVTHGLLLASWVCQAVQRHYRHPQPLAEASFRFRAPLRPAVAATVGGSRAPAGVYKMTVESLHGIHVTATVRPRNE